MTTQITPNKEFILFQNKFWVIRQTHDLTAKTSSLAVENKITGYIDNPIIEHHDGAPRLRFQKPKKIPAYIQDRMLSIFVRPYRPARYTDSTLNRGNKEVIEGWINFYHLAQACIESILEEPLDAGLSPQEVEARFNRLLNSDRSLELPFASINMVNKDTGYKLELHLLRTIANTDTARFLKYREILSFRFKTVADLTDKLRYEHTRCVNKARSYTTKLEQTDWFE